MNGILGNWLPAIPIGAREIETLVTFEGDISESYRRAGVSDLPEMIEIAMISYTEDRLHRDPTVRNELANAVKAKWVMDADADPSRFLYVAQREDRILAFVSLKMTGAGHQVDLLAVHPDFRGQGIARSLLLYAAGAERVGKLLAGTQDTNEPAKKLYDSLGMVIVKRERTYHRP